MKRFLRIFVFFVVPAVFFSPFVTRVFAQTPIVRYLYSIDGGNTGLPFKGISRLFYDSYREELYIIDNLTGRIVITGNDGVMVHAFSYTDAGLNKYPNDITVAKNGDIYIAEETRIAMLNYRGDYKRDVDLSVLPVKESIQSITVDEEGRLYIGMTRRLAVIDGKGAFLFEVVSSDGGGDFVNVRKVRVTKDSIYTIDPARFKVYRFSKEGKFILSFGKISGLAGGFSMPLDMDIDRRAERVAVMDINRYAVIFFTFGGEFLFEFGDKMSTPRPTSIAVDNEGRLYVVTAGSGIVRVFQLKEEAAPEKIDLTPSSLPEEPGN